MSIKRKKFLKIFIISAFLLVAGFEWLLFSVTRWINPDAYQKQILEVIKKQTGQDIKIGGNINFTLLPTPRLVVTDLEVDSNSDKTSSIPTLTASRLEVYIAPMSIFSDNVELTGIALINPILSLERADDNTIHWAWFNTKLLKALNTSDSNMKSPPLLISGGALKYQDKINNENLFIENLDTMVAYGKQLFIKGKMRSSGRIFDFAIDGNESDLPVTENKFPLNLTVTAEDGSIFKILSIINPSSDFPKIAGKLDVNISNFWEWFVTTSQGNNLQRKNGKPTENNKNTTPMVLPVTVSGIWNLDDGVVKMTKLNIKGLNSQGAGNANLSWSNWYPTITADLDFAYIDYIVWKKVIDNRILARKPIAKKDYDYIPNYDFNKENPLPENIELRLNINAQKILFEKEEWLHTKLNAVLDKGALTINQCDIKLGGGGLLSIFGVVSQGGTGDLRFEGNMEAKGKSLHEALVMFYSSAKDLPNISMGEFSIRSNLYINSEQLRLFEADATVSGMPISGTLTTYLTDQPRIEAKIKLKDVNFDYIRDVLLKRNTEAEIKTHPFSNLTEKKPEQIVDNKPADASFEWLKNLRTRIDANVYVDGFNFMENKGDKASFSIYAYNGDFRLSDMQLLYPNATADLACNLNVNGERPYISLLVNADQLDTSYFYPKKQISEKLSQQDFANRENKPIKKKDAVPLKANVQEERLKDYIDIAIPLEWMDNFNGNFDISLKKFIHKNLKIEKIKLQAKLENRNLTIQRLGFIYSQAESNIVGTLYGGKIPGILVNFTMSNADIYEILEPSVALQNISGYASLSGRISTNGWNLREWIKRMDGQFLISARGVKVQGINIAGIGNVVDVAQSSADVFNNVNNVLTKGSTEFLVDGAINIKDGEMRAPNLTLRSGLVTGSITGGIKLESLIMQFSALFRFANLSTDYIPQMIIRLSGGLNNPEIKVDTASLEDFVAKRNVGRNIGK